MDVAQGAGSSWMSMLLMFGAMFAIMYFVMIRPQQKQQKKHRDMLAGLKRGDEVLLTSGIIGRIVSLEERIVSLEVADKTKIRVLKQAISSVVPSPAEVVQDTDTQKKNSLSS